MPIKIIKKIRNLKHITTDVFKYNKHFKKRREKIPNVKNNKNESIHTWRGVERMVYIIPNV